MGTPSYMPPEQAAGKTQEVDRSSDVYSLGAILYELVTGGPPFRSQRVIETIRLVMEAPVVPPSSIRKETPPEVESIILKALEKQKADRYPTASQFVKALELVAANPPSTVRERVPAAAAAAAPPRKSAAKAVFWGVILLVLSILAGLGVLQLIRGGPTVAP
jgi:serine/threonine protein kinase